MKNKIYGLAGIALVAVILAIGAVSAYGMGRNREAFAGMQKIMETGSYSDFVNFRENAGYNMKPWVQSEDDFELAKKMHARMKLWYSQGDSSSDDDRIGNFRCPMHNKIFI